MFWLPRISALSSKASRSSRGTILGALVAHRTVVIEKHFLGWPSCYNALVSELVERAIETARNATPAVQEEAARLLLRFLGKDQAVYELTPTEVASLTEARAQASRRDFATDEQVRAVWAKYDL